MIVAIEERVPAFKVFRHHRSFTLIWIGQFISTLGDNIYRVALAWEVLLLTGSAFAMGIVFLCELVPTILFTLVGGVAADRISRRSILLWSDGGRACVVGLVAVLALLHGLQFWHLVGLSFLFGIADAFFTPAYQSIAPQLVENEFLQPANSLSRLGFLLSRVFGPPIGALIVVAAGGPASAFALDALSFLASVGFLLVLRLPSAKPAVPREGGQSLAIHSLLLDIRDGLRYVKKTTWLWVTIIVAAVSNVTFMVPLAVSLPKLVHDVYGAGPWLYGVLIAADGAGAIVAAILLAQLHHLHRRGILAYGCLLISFLSLTVLGLPLPRASEPVVATLACVFAGFGLGIFEILEMTFLQENVPEDKLGRVFSVDMFGSYLLIPLGLLLVGALTDRIGPAVIFVIGGMLSLILALAALLVRDIRELK